MRRAFGLLAVIVAGFTGVSRLEAQCAYSVPMFHADSYFVCPDGRPVYAFAYQLSEPASVNSGTAKIRCPTSKRGETPMTIDAPHTAR